MDSTACVVKRNALLACLHSVCESIVGVPKKTVTSLRSPIGEALVEEKRKTVESGLGTKKNLVDHIGKANPIKKAIGGREKIWALTLVRPIFSIADKARGSHFAVSAVAMKKKVVSQLEAELVPLKIGVAGLHFDQSLDEEA